MDRPRGISDADCSVGQLGRMSFLPHCNSVDELPDIYRNDGSVVARVLARERWRLVLL